jgi:hypothetical protein
MFPKIFSRNLIKSLKIVKVGEVDVLLDDAVECGARFLKDNLEVLENASKLSFSISFDKLVCLWVKRDAGRGKDKVPVDDSVNIGADGARGTVGADCLHDCGFKDADLSFGLKVRG